MNSNRLFAIGLCVVIVAAALLVALRGYLRHVACVKKDEAFIARLNALQHDAESSLPIGTKKSDVVSFFDQHGMRYVFADIASKFQAQGTLQTTGGCKPLGCGTDNVFVGVFVNVDAEGTVVEAPRVRNMYIDCL